MKKLTIIIMVIMLASCMCEPKVTAVGMDGTDISADVNTTCDITGITQVFNTLNNFGISFGSEN